MQSTIDIERLKAAKERVARKAQMRGELPRLREEAGQFRYRISFLAHQVEGLEATVQALSGETWRSKLFDIWGRREKDHAARAQELEALCRELADQEAQLEACNARITELEAAFAGLHDADEQYQAVLAAQGELPDGEEADDMQRCASQLGAVQREVRHLEKSLATGEHLIEQLHNVNRAFAKAGTKMAMPNPLGAIGQVVSEAYTRRNAKPAVGFARDGISRFLRLLEAIELTDAPLDLEIGRMVAELTVAEAHLRGLPSCNTSDVVPLLEMVHTILGFLRDKLDGVGPELKRLEAELETHLAEVV